MEKGPMASPQSRDDQGANPSKASLNAAACRPLATTVTGPEDLLIPGCLNPVTSTTPDLGTDRAPAGSGANAAAATMIASPVSPPRNHLICKL